MTSKYFYGHGKLLLTGEYLVLKGAKALAIPTILGQSMAVKSKKSLSPKINWKSLDHQGNVWFSAEFELWHFDMIHLIEGEENTSLFIQKLLTSARELNPHFLRDSLEYSVETRIEFPLNWGMGSSSSLVYNIAQWAYISPFQLSDRTMNGSGYDIACAQSKYPLIYQLEFDHQDRREPNWESLSFVPSFKDDIYFLYLNKKIDSYHEVKRFNALNLSKAKLNESIQLINKITNEIKANFNHKQRFIELIREHESIISAIIQKETIQSQHFADYPGVIKSLGAWGGDFAMVICDQSEFNNHEYFKSKGYETLIHYDEIACQRILNQGMPQTESYSPYEMEY